MREVEMMIEESKKVIDDAENDDEDFSSSDGENHVKMLNAGDPRGLAPPTNQILPDVKSKRVINSHRAYVPEEDEEIEEGG